MNARDRVFRDRLRKHLESGAAELDEALAILDAWQDMDTNDMTGGHTRTVYCNYGSGRSDR